MSATSRSAPRPCAAIVTDLKGTVAGQAEALAALDGLERRDRRPDRPGGRGRRPAGGYRPAAAPRCWKPGDPGRDGAIARLRSWVEEVYRPGYGHLAAGLGECWEQHPLCLYVLDWLSELWSVLYLRRRAPRGRWPAQAEWHTRLLTAAAGQLARETRGCAPRRRSPEPGRHGSPADDRPRHRGSGAGVRRARLAGVPLPARDQGTRDPARLPRRDDRPRPDRLVVAAPARRERCSRHRRARPGRARRRPARPGGQRLRRPEPAQARRAG